MTGSKAAMLLLAFASAGIGASGPRPEPAAQKLAPIESVPANALHGFSVVSDDTLIVWTTPRKPYLVRLFRPSRELKFATTIDVSSFGRRIHARFDTVEVDGFSYPIRAIYELSRNDAEALAATGRASDDPTVATCRAADVEAKTHLAETCAS